MAHREASDPLKLHAKQTPTNITGDSPRCLIKHSYSLRYGDPGKYQFRNTQKVERSNHQLDGFSYS